MLRYKIISLLHQLVLLTMKQYQILYFRPIIQTEDVYITKKKSENIKELISNKLTPVEMEIYISLLYYRFQP